MEKHADKKDGNESKKEAGERMEIYQRKMELRLPLVDI